MASSFRFNDDGLKRLGRLFGESGTIVRVGILTGPKKARKIKTGDPNDDATNADIGAEQEFGSFTKKIPPRSFLYKPLSGAKAKKRIVAEAAEGLERELTRGAVVDAKESFYGKIGAGMVAAVQDAFDESGPGWKPLARETILRRRTRKVYPRTGTKPLIDIGELRNAVSFKVLGGGQ